jgi:hypothetical protein
MPDDDQITPENQIDLSALPAFKQKQAERINDVPSFTSKDEWIDWLNKSYAAIDVGPKFKILHEDKYGNINFKDKKIFIDSLADIRISITSAEDGKTKLVPISEIWLLSSRKRRYYGITFNPEIDGHYDGLYNLWKGYKYVAKFGSVEPFMDLMKNIICAGHEDNFNYLAALIAQMFQRPWDKPGIAVVIRGDEGVGKSFFLEKLGELMYPYYFKTSNPAYIFGDHNSQLANKIMLHLEEAVWAGSKKDESLLKDLITGKTIEINEKFMPVYSVPNHLHLFISGNPEWLVSAGFKARRIFALHAAEYHRRDTTYFSELNKWFNNGGAEALMHYFMNHKSDIDLRIVPVTEELIFQKERSQSGVSEWLYSIVDSREMPYGEYIKETGHVHVIKALLHNNYNNSAAGQRHKLSERQFGRILTDLLPLVVDGIEQKSGNRILTILGTENLKIRDSRDTRRNGYDWPSNTDIRRLLEFKLGGKCNWSIEDGNWEVLRGNTDFDFSLYKPD